MTAAETLSKNPALYQAGGHAFSASGLPASLSVSPGGLLSGTPTSDDLAGSPYTVTVTAVDPGGLEAEDTFELSILPGDLFSDGFESGDTAEWNNTVP